MQHKLYAGFLIVKRGSLDHDLTLIAPAISIAPGSSAAVTLGFPGMPLWEKLATLAVIMLLGPESRCARSPGRMAR